MTKHILLATDFSTRSDRALRRATLIAKQLSAALTMVYVVDSDQPQYLMDAQMNAARSLLEESARTVVEYDGISADAKVVAGDVFTGILQVAEDVAADLVILGPHRRQLRDAFIGTTAERTIAHSSRPVLMTAGVPSAPYDRVLVALDLDENSCSAARMAREIGVLGGAEIVAMHAFDAPARGMMYRAMSEPAAIDHYVEGEERQASDDFRTFLAGAGLESARQRVAPINGTAARTILESARQEEASLIVVGTSQRKGVHRIMIGSVARDVLEDADRDILVVPQ